MFMEKKYSINTLFNGINEYTLDAKNRLWIPADYRSVISERNSVNLKKFKEEASLEKQLEFLEISQVSNFNDSNLLKLVDRRIYLEKSIDEEGLRCYSALDYAIRGVKEFEYFLVCQMDAQHRITLPDMQFLFPELLLLKSNINRRRDTKGLVEEHEKGVMIYGRRDHFYLRPSLMVYFKKN